MGREDGKTCIERGDGKIWSGKTEGKRGWENLEWKGREDLDEKTWGRKRGREDLEREDFEGKRGPIDVGREEKTGRLDEKNRREEMRLFGAVRFGREDLEKICSGKTCMGREETGRHGRESI